MLHARRRAKQRLGEKLSKTKLAAMIRAIQRGRARPVGKTSTTRTHFLFKSGDRHYVAVYSNRMKTIITVWCARPGTYDIEMAVAV